MPEGCFRLPEGCFASWPPTFTIALHNFLPNRTEPTDRPSDPLRKYSVSECVCVCLLWSPPPPPTNVESRVFGSVSFELEKNFGARTGARAGVAVVVASLVR